MSDNLEICVEKLNLTLDMIRKISNARNLNPQTVIKVLKYNVLTPGQLGFITGRSVSTINNLVANDMLAVTYPYPDDKRGPKFILVDYKCMEYIKTCLEIQ